MKKIRIYWTVSLFFAILFLAINYFFYPIKKIVALEFSSSPEILQGYILGIGCDPSCCYHILKMNTIVDFGFIVAYSLLAYFSFRQLLDVFQIHFGWWVYALSFIPGLLDVIENLFLLKTGMDEQVYFSWIFSWVVRLKWAFAIVPFLLIPIVMLYILVIVFRSKANDG
jgi:hypothetical protein